MKPGARDGFHPPYLGFSHAEVMALTEDWAEFYLTELNREESAWRRAVEKK